MLANILTKGEINNLYRIANNNYIKIMVQPHFFQRWNERVNKKFKNKYELEEHLEYLYNNKKIRNIKGEHYIIDDDIIVVAKKYKDRIVFITTYGSTKNNQILYNMCLCGDIYRNFAKYGKIKLNAI